MDVLSDSVSSDINTRVNTINAMASTISSGIKSHFNSISQSIDHISRRLNNDDDANIGDDNQMLNTLWINIVCGAALIIIFESCRGMKSIFLKRLNKKFLKLRRVPPQPSPYPLFWIRDILKISDEEVLRMIGLDGYMLLRYLKILFRVALFFSVCGALVLVPVYQVNTPIIMYNYAILALLLQQLVTSTG